MRFHLLIHENLDFSAVTEVHKAKSNLSLADVTDVGEHEVTRIIHIERADIDHGVIVSALVLENREVEVLFRLEIRIEILRLFTFFHEHGVQRCMHRLLDTRCNHSERVSYQLNRALMQHLTRISLYDGDISILTQFLCGGSKNKK